MQDKRVNNKNNKLLVSPDSSPIKIYLDGFGVLDFLRIARLIQAHGGKVLKPADDTLVLTRPHHPSGTEFLRFNINWLYDSIRDQKRQDIGKYLLPAMTSDNQRDQVTNDSRLKETETDNSDVQKEKTQKDNDVDELFRGFSNAKELTEDENAEGTIISEDSRANSDLGEPEQERSVAEPEAEKENILIDMNDDVINVDNSNGTLDKASNAAIIIFKDPESMIEVEIPKENEPELPIVSENSELSSGIQRQENSTNLQSISMVVLPKFQGKHLTDGLLENTNEEMNDDIVQLEEEEEDDGEIQDCIDEEKDKMDDSDASINGCWRFAGNEAEDKEASSMNSDDHSSAATSLIAAEADIPGIPKSVKDIEEKKVVTPMKTRFKRLHPVTVSSEPSKKHLKADVLPKIKYSIEEDEMIIQYLIDKKAVSRAEGMSIWDEMVSEGILPNRSATSLKFRFATSLKHKVSDHKDDQMDLKENRQLTKDT